MSAADDPKLCILVIDDDEDVRETLGDYLRRRNHHVRMADCAENGLEILRTEAIDIVVTDLKLPDLDGFEVLRRAREIAPDVEVIMITAFGDLDNAVTAMREGAFDFFTKPLDVQDLDAALQRTVRFHALRLQSERYRERLEQLDLDARERYGLEAMIGNSPGIRAVRASIVQVCEADATTVLIQGETGTGKELVARAIHHESAREKGPFIAVNCSAIPASLIESALYGHVKGAFTDARESRKGYFELAHGGTLLLDEIGDMDLGMQARLLRTLEERRIRPVGGASEIPVDVRVVSATNRNLHNEVAEGRFREDLYYRLNAFTIHLPGLEERPEDILPLARHFLETYARELRKPIEGFSLEVIAMLQAHAFPGNVRELRNLVERAVILCTSRQVMSENLQFDGASTPVPSRSAPPAPIADQADDLNLAGVEQAYILEALRRSGGNRAGAARLLGISRDALRRRMEKYGIG